MWCACVCVCVCVCRCVCGVHVCVCVCVCGVCVLSKAGVPRPPLCSVYALTDSYSRHTLCPASLCEQLHMYGVSIATVGQRDILFETL